MLRTKEVGINFVQGMDTKTDEILNQKLDLLQNCTLTKEGTPRKRDGFTPLTRDVLDSASDISIGEKLDTILNELCVTGGYRHLSLAQNETLWAENTITEFANFDMSTVISTEALGSVQDVCFSRGTDFTLLTYTISSAYPQGSHAVFIDNQTGLVFKRFEYSLAQATRLRPIFFNGVYVVVRVSSTGDLVAEKYALVANAFVQTTLVVDTGVNITTFDLVTNGTVTAIGYFKAATNNLYVTTISTAPAVVNTLVNSGFTGTYHKGQIGLSWSTFNSIFWVSAFGDAAGVDHIVTLGLTSALAVLKISSWVSGVAHPNDTPINITPVSRDATKLVIFFEYTTIVASETFYQVSYLVVDFVTFALDSTNLLGLKLTLASSGFVVNGRAHVICTVQQTTVSPYNVGDVALNSSYVMMGELTTSPKNGTIAPIAACFLHSKAFFEADLGNILLSRVTDGSEFYARSVKEILGPVGTVFGEYQIHAMTFEYANFDSSKAIEAGNRLMYPGASPKTYDGKIVYESQFHYGPAVSALTPAGGGGLSAGTYRWVFVFTYYDSKGIRVVSNPSQEQVSAVAAGNQVTFSVQGYNIGALTGCFIDMYRTTVNGDTFFFESRTINNSGVVQQTIISTIADSTIQNQETYFYPGEVLESQFIGPYKSHVLFKNRLVYIPLDEEDAIAYSKEFNKSEQYGFNEFLKLFIEDNNYAQDEFAKCLGVLDDKLIIFKDTSIFFVIGDGPNDSGEQNNFSRPQVIATDVGCANAKSICLTPMGLMFKSQKGIYLLTRGLEVKYVGADVEDYNSLEITSSLLLEDKNEVIFTTRTAQALVFDYLHGQWSIFENWSAQDSCFWKGKAAHLKDDGLVNVQNTTFDDNGDFIPQKIITGWIKMSDIQNFGRVRRFLLVGKFKSAHQMKVSASYDYEQFAWTEYTLTPLAASAYNITVKPSLSDLYAGGIDGVYQWELHLQKQKCMAVKFMIEDVETSAVGESYSLTNMTMELGIKSGPNKVQKEKKG